MREAETLCRRYPSSSATSSSVGAVMAIVGVTNASIPRSRASTESIHARTRRRRSMYSLAGSSPNVLTRVQTFGSSVGTQSPNRLVSVA